MGPLVSLLKRRRVEKERDREERRLVGELEGSGIVGLEEARALRAERLNSLTLERPASEMSTIVPSFRTRHVTTTCPFSVMTRTGIIQLLRT